MNDLQRAANAAGAGQAIQSGPYPKEQGNLAAQVALQSQEAVLAAYDKAGQDAIAMNGMNVRSAIIDSTSVQSAENPYIQFDIVNSGGTDETVIIGSVLGLAGAAPFFGAAASAADSATVADQFGAGVRAVQGFGLFCNYSPVIVNGLQMISDSVTQRAQPFRYNSIAYDTTQCQIVNNTTATFTRFDSDPDVIKLGGIWSLGPMQNISILSKAGEDMSIIVYLVAAATIRNYRKIQQ